MVSIGMFSSVNTVLVVLNWLVYLAGAIMALLLLVRHKNVASVLALVGFGIPALTTPVFAILRWLVADRLGFPAVVAIASLNGLLSFGAAICLVIAFWLALRSATADEGERPAA